MKPSNGFNEAAADVYPNLHVHTLDIYEADGKGDETDGNSCIKEHNESPTITGGITYITYHMHPIHHKRFYCHAKR